jgi:hypothetical protein
MKRLIAISEFVSTTSRSVIAGYLRSGGKKEAVVSSRQ